MLQHKIPPGKPIRSLLRQGDIHPQGFPIFIGTIQPEMSRAVAHLELGTGKGQRPDVSEVIQGGAAGFPDQDSSSLLELIRIDQPL